MNDYIQGKPVLKKTIQLSASGNIHTPASGKRIRLFAVKCSLSADMTSVSVRFGSGGTDFDIYLSPKTGGLYGSNMHPNWLDGAVDTVLYTVINGTGNVQFNIDYQEV